MTKKIETTETENGQKVYGGRVPDKIGSYAIVHESSVPEDEGGPFLWLSLQRDGQDESLGVLLDSSMVDDVIDRLKAAQKDLWG